MDDMGSKSAEPETHRPAAPSLNELKRLPTERADTVLRKAYALGLKVFLPDGMAQLTASAGLERAAKILEDRASEWADIYEAEQLIVQRFKEPQVEAEMTRRIVEAEALGVRSASALKSAYDKTPDPEQRKAILLTLIDDIQFRYSKRRLDRDELQRATFRLNWIGFGLLVVIIVSSLRLLIEQQPWEAVRYHQFWVLYFGLLGAYFSRALDLSVTQGKFDYDVMAINYSWWALGRRLIAGAVGALLFYCLVRGGLVGGDLFPEPDFAELMRNAKLYIDPHNGVSMPMITPNFGKLLIWSTIAGFSERLIPEQFNRLETPAQPAKPSAAS